MSRIYVVYVNDTPRCYETSKSRAESAMKKILDLEFSTDLENRTYHLDSVFDNSDVETSVMYSLVSVPKNSPTVYDQRIATASIVTVNSN